MIHKFVLCIYALFENQSWITLELCIVENFHPKSLFYFLCVSISWTLTWWNKSETVSKHLLRRRTTNRVGSFAWCFWSDSCEIYVRGRRGFCFDWWSLGRNSSWKLDSIWTERLTLILWGVGLTPSVLQDCSVPSRQSWATKTNFGAESSSKSLNFVSKNFQFSAQIALKQFHQRHNVSLSGALIKEL